MRPLPITPWQMPMPKMPSFPTFANHGVHSLRLGTLPRNEFGFPLCQLPDGRLDRNVPVSWGTPTSVDVDSRCPPGTRFLGVTHSHPGGVPFPSQIDQRAAAASRSQLMCIVADGPAARDHVLNCFRVQVAR